MGRRASALLSLQRAWVLWSWAEPNAAVMVEQVGLSVCVYILFSVLLGLFDK